MKKYISILTIAFLPFSLFAIDEKAIEATMKAYWTAWTGQDLQKAATYIASKELEKGKNALLPVFLEAQKSKAQDTQEITDVFFGKNKGLDREKMSKEDVFVGVNNIVLILMGEIVNTLKISSIDVTSITPDGENSAIIRYNIILDGEVFAEDFERLEKHEKKWYLRYKEEPTVTARKFNTLLNE